MHPFSFAERIISEQYKMVMIMRLLFKIILGITKTGLYVLFAELFMNRTIRFLRDRKTYVISTMIAIMLSISNYYERDWTIAVASIVVLLALTFLGVLTEEKRGVTQSLVGAIESYVAVFLVCFIIGVVLGVFAKFYSKSLDAYGKYMIVIGMRMLCLILVWVKYDWLQQQVKKSVANVLILVGAIFMFFQQLAQTAFVTKDYSLINIVVIFLHFTMIFTAFMLLQHNRLTAKQQAMEEDNRQMSQRLHRSKDVIGVVSQVVASERHIDPKLRQELADFCDDEMNEMQDRALGVNLIGDTGVELINVMLQRQMMRCADENISFDVMIPAPIDAYIRDIGISVTEFMRMLNDLLKNAVKAILASENAHRELLLIMGEAGNGCLEIQIYDSGVPFPATILAHFGERGNTTDGTGNGIADTVATLGRYNASLALEVIEPGTDIYTKCIHIAFDGKNQMILN